MGIFSRFENKAEDVIEGSGGRGRGGLEPSNSRSVLARRWSTKR